MFRSIICGLACCVAIGLAPTSSAAQNSLDQRANLRTISSFEGLAGKVKRQAMTLFRLNDLDAIPGISSVDRTLLIARHAAGIRSRQIAKWLISDLNGDLSITVDELRATTIPKAYKPLRGGHGPTIPTREQAEEFIAAEIEKKLRIDLNNDRVISFEEILDSVEAILDGSPNLDPRARMLPTLEMDLDRDGNVTDAEMGLAIDDLIALIDLDSDGEVTTAERQAMQRKLRDSKPDATRDYLLNALKKRRKCVFPKPEDGQLLAVIGGYEGSGLSDIHFGDTADTVEVIDLLIPDDGPAIYLVVAVNGSTIVRVSDKSERLKQVIMTGGEVALMGDGVVIPQRVHSQCNLELWDRVSKNNPDPSVFFGERLGRIPDRIVKAYSLGVINLASGNNNEIDRLTNARPTPDGGVSAAAWDRFHLFNPGGLVSIDPDEIRSLQPVFRHDLLPQFAGIARLIETGVLIKIQGGTARRQVTETMEGVVLLGKKKYRPGGGDDSITFEGLKYTEERPRVWIGREEDVYLATRPFTFPAGLLGAHAVTILVPEGMDVPRGNPGHSTIRRLDQNAIAPAKDP